MRILVAARSRGIAAIDGPYLAIRDLDGLHKDAASAAALGYDGKWVLHPGQVEPVNQVFAPDQEAYDRAELILDAYAHATDVRQTGAVMLGDEMIDEGIPQAGPGHRGQGMRGRAGPHPGLRSRCRRGLS